MLTYAFMAILSLCSHTHSHLCFSHMFVQSHLCTNVNTQMGRTFAQCTPHVVTSSNPPTGTHSLSVTQEGTLTLTTAFSHSEIVVSHTQPTDCSLTLVYTFSQTQHALVWLHNHICTATHR